MNPAQQAMLDYATLISLADPAWVQDYAEQIVKVFLDIAALLAPPPAAAPPAPPKKP